MASSVSRRRGCHRSLPLSSTFLLLALLPPHASYTFAQSTDPASSGQSATSTSPTTLQSSLLTSTASDAASSTSSDQGSAQASQPSEFSGDQGDQNQSQSNGVGFNYYFLLIAVVAILFCLCIVYIGKRKKRKAVLNRSQSQRALQRDVEGWGQRMNRFGIRRVGLGPFGAGGSGDSRTEEEREREMRAQGLDMDGNPPPAYDGLGTKPPSIMSTDGIGTQERGESLTPEAHGAVEEVEMRELSHAEVSESSVPKTPKVVEYDVGAHDEHNEYTHGNTTERTNNNNGHSIGHADGHVTETKIMTTNNTNETTGNGENGGASREAVNLPTVHTDSLMTDTGGLDGSGEHTEMPPEAGDGLARPQTAVVADERLASTRRLSSNTGSAS